MQNLRLDTAFSSLKKLASDLSESVPVKGILQKLNQLSLPRFDWPSFRIGDLTARIPVVQGGMGVGISLSGLASAVASEGGIGIIAANAIGMLEPDYFKDGRAANLRALRREIRSAREKSDGILGVNIMVAVNDFHELLDVAIEEKVDLVFMGAGLPIKNIPVEKMRAAGVKAVPIISSARAAEMIFKMWKKIYNDVPDALVFEGPKAGGHLGFSEEQIDDPAFQLESIVPQVVEAVRPYEKEFQRRIPVIAGGGIFTGEDIHGALELGASAVQMGTRFVATHECDADAAFKEAYVQCSAEDIGLIQSPVGMPGRAIRNSFIEDSEAGRRPSFKCAWQCLASCKAEKARYCISIALNNARRGKLNQGFVFAGSNAYRVEKILSVAALMGELAEGFRQTARSKVAGRIEAAVAEIQDLRAQYESMRLQFQDFQTAIMDRFSQVLPLIRA
ncbi:NAD(P)H-dependent flavin oxidoreductase [Marispirochaeta aestuarii]|uniref:NAD(P)H-dependent flavin oxidoreductase n=1 Tax=Marispirochaeta aestuarii TaxID=1963862 RepID=UPI001E4B533D|nr:nitronate monooxygenase [Marispirochaeta aestuarii]